MMDSIEFVKQLRRMNEQGVPKKRFIYPCAGQETDSPEEVVAEVEEWAKDHPVKTRQSVFLEQFPNAPIYTNTHNVALDPCLIDTTLRGHCPTGRGCDICRREFWLAEVEDT